MNEIPNDLLYANSSELEKLRLANQFVNKLLDGNKVENSIKTKDELYEENTNTTNELEYVKPEENVVKPKVIPDDKWGASEYLWQGTRFKFVTDYLDRTEKLLKMRNDTTSLPHSSYEIVSSTSELLSRPISKFDQSDTESDFSEKSNDESCSGMQYETTTSTSSGGELDVNVFDENNLVEAQHSSQNYVAEFNAPHFIHKTKSNDCGLLTHRPTIAIEQLSVFKPSHVVSNLEDQNMPEYNQETDFVPQVAEKFKELSINNATCSAEPLVDEIPLSNSLGQSYLAQEKSFPIAEEMLSSDNSFYVSDSSSFQHHPATEHKNVPLLKMLIDDDNKSSMVLEDLSDDNAAAQENVGNVSEQYNVNIVAESLDSLQSLPVEPKVKMKSFSLQSTSSNNDSFDSLQIVSENKGLIEIPKLNLGEDKDTDSNTQKDMELGKDRCCIDQNSFNNKDKKQNRPISADAYQPKHKTNLHSQNNSMSPNLSDKVVKSSTKLKRPSTAGKVNDVLKTNTSPKRVWQKSSIAWSSYGSRQLKTWSSVKMSPVKVQSYDSTFIAPTANETAQKHETKAITKKSPKYDIKNHTPLFSCIRRIFLTDLPDEILLHIFSFLTTKDLLSVARVCHTFCRVSNDCQLWKTVEASNVTLTDQWLDSIGRRTPKQVVISNCNGKAIKNKGLRNFFKQCKFTLKQFHLENCSGEMLSGDAVLLHASCHCRILNHISIPWSSTGDNGLMAICLALPKITTLNINGNSAISDEAVDVLAQKHGKHLCTLEMAGCFSVSSDCLLTLLLSTEALQVLNIGLCSKVTESCVISLTKHLTLLCHLDLHGIKVVNDHCVHSIVTHCKALQNLNISNCTLVSDVGMAEIATYLNTLSLLDISGCSKVTDQGINNFLLVAKSISYLDLSSTGATHASVSTLVENNSNTISTLKLSFCRNITQNCLVDLLNVAVGLKSLHLYGCKRLKLSALMKINDNVIVEK